MTELNHIQLFLFFNIDVSVFFYSILGDLLKAVNNYSLKTVSILVLRSNINNLERIGLVYQIIYYHSLLR